MIIKVLNDNLSSSEKFKCEHGLSLYVEHNEFKFLFDAGQTDLFIQNACLLGVILNDIDFIVSERDISDCFQDHKDKFI